MIFLAGASLAAGFCFEPETALSEAKAPVAAKIAIARAIVKELIFTIRE